MSDDERAAVAKGLAEADQSKFVADGLVAEADKPRDSELIQRAFHRGR